MDIYQIQDDFEHYQSILTLTDDDFFLNDEVKIIENWKIPIWQHQPSLSKKHRKNQKTDNDASCYHTGHLIMKEKIAEKMQKELAVSVQLLPIKVISSPEKFVFVNVLSKINAINEEGLSIEESIDRMNNKKVIFNANNIGNQILFRDDIYVSFYFCTDRFIEWVHKNNIKGLRFEKQGQAL